MQLDPNSPFAKQLRAVGSRRLERLAAATLASVGYTVFREAVVELGGQHVAKPDILACVFTPLRESRVFVECKGGHPTFRQILEFASLRHVVSPPADDLVMICKHGCPANRTELGESLGVRIVERGNLVHYVIPMLGGAASRQRRAVELNRYLAWQLVHEYLVGRTSNHASMQQHYRYLWTVLWVISDPADQVADSLSAYQTRFPRTSDDVAQAKGMTTMDCLKNAQDDDVEAAMYVSLLHRLLNVYAVMRRTLQILNQEDTERLVASAGPNLRSAMSRLSESPRYFYGFPAFLQTYFFVWGGFLLNAERDWEVQRLAHETDTTVEAVELYLDVLSRIFTGTSGSIFQTNWGMTYFPYVPAAFRALGIRHRQALDSARYSSTAFFRSSAVYDAALDRALEKIGGVSGLIY